MAFWITKKALIRCLAEVNTLLSPRTEPVRRNAASIWPLFRPFSSNPSNTPSFQTTQTLNLEGQNPEDVAELLRGHGLSDSDISEVERRCPSIFRPAHQRSLPGQLQFLESIGFSRSDQVELVTRNPFVLVTNFENQIIPCYNYLKNLPMNNDQLFKLLKDKPGVLLTKVETIIAPNVELLRGMGIPSSSIASFVVLNHNAICRNHERFKVAVELALAMRLDPEMKLFLHAVRVLCQISKQTWDQKVKLFRSFGFSDDDIALAFRRQPYVMAMSEKKMEKVMEFFLKELSWPPTALATDPVILLMNFEKRVVPRVHVMEILKEKGLFKKKLSVVSFLKMSEDEFLLRFIESHKEDLPELIDIYK